MPSPTAVTTKAPPLLGRGFLVRTPREESSADVAGVEPERVTDGDEREGTVRVIGSEPGLHLREETPRSRALVPCAAMEREDGVGKDRDLEALLGLNPRTSEGRVVELGG